jgi:hypothetical protein
MNGGAGMNFARIRWKIVRWTGHWSDCTFDWTLVALFGCRFRDMDGHQKTIHAAFK